jgi:hypothetical protein
MTTGRAQSCCRSADNDLAAHASHEVKQVSALVDMTVERTGRVHPATVKDPIEIVKAPIGHCHLPAPHT